MLYLNSKNYFFKIIWLLKFLFIIFYDILIDILILYFKGIVKLNMLLYVRFKYGNVYKNEIENW